MYFVSLFFILQLVRHDVFAANVVYLSVDGLSAAGRASLGSVFCAYGTSASYAGAIFRLQRHKDDATTEDFYSDGAGNLKTASNVNLLTWSHATLYPLVKTWYDQSGNNRHATQSDVNLMPRYVHSAKYVDFKGYTGSTGTKVLSLPYTVLPTGNGAYSFVAQHGAIDNAGGGIFGVGQAAQSFSCINARRNGGGYRLYWWDRDNDFNTYAVQNIVSETYDPVSRERIAYVDSQLAGSITYTAGVGRNSLAINGYIGSSVVNPGENLDGQLYYLVTSFMALSVTDRKTLEGNAPPTLQPSKLPSINPSQKPSVVPSLNPSCIPTLIPTAMPTEIPSLSPTCGAVIDGCSWNSHTDVQIASSCGSCEIVTREFTVHEGYNKTVTTITRPFRCDCSGAVF